MVSHSGYAFTDRGSDLILCFVDKTFFLFVCLAYMFLHVLPIFLSFTWSPLRKKFVYFVLKIPHDAVWFCEMSSRWSNQWLLITFVT